jgi:branched-chain amino acid transport system ATP-binding protein
MSASAVLTVEKARKAFGGLIAVNDVSFELYEGEILGLIGPNGSGKTTMLNLISGVFKPTGGEIRLHGEPLTRLPAHRISDRGVRRTFQLVRALHGMSAQENVVAGMAFGPDHLWGAAADRRADELLHLVGLGGRGSEYPPQMTYIDQKRIELARAIARKPEVLLLDEWLAGLNPAELNIAVGLIKRLKSQGYTIVLVEHVIEAIRALCDRCVVMNAGRKIADGDPDAVLADREVVRAYIGEPDA